jgi:hypothetical protein
VTATVAAVPSDEGSEDPHAEWKAAVATEKARGLAAADAVLAVDRKHPGLRERMLAAVNA